MISAAGICSRSAGCIKNTPPAGTLLAPGRCFYEDFFNHSLKKQPQADRGTDWSVKLKKAVILEADAVNPGDLSWEPVESVCDLTIYDQTDEQTKWDHIGGAEIVLTNKVIIDEEVFRRFPSIRYVGVCATGYNVVDLDAARRRGIVVTNVPSYSTASVAQHTFALMLDLLSKISLHDASVKAGDWTRSKSFCYWKAPVDDIEGKVLGICGFGSIGRRVSEIAQAFGMKVIVYTQHPGNYLSFVGPSLRFADLTSMLSFSDIVSLHCPLTDDTKELIRRETIRRMKDGAYLINVARGGLVNEQDLADALGSGKLAGAGVDVVSDEPMKADSPLLSAPNILITPHIAWASRASRKCLIDRIASNIGAWVSGAPQNVVS
jgi:glycerate dehydrogenase